ncbi:MAG: dephospho-CoA kinase [Peptococcaceae bacterium]|nr:dephospho-CoA kinase [Peptococcaceae bacterium]
MLIIGLTGGIASGKSMVSHILRELGADIIDADKVTLELQQPNTPAWQEIVAEFGEGMLRSDNSLDRRALGDLVFHNPAALRRLNQIVHPKVIARTNELIAQIAAHNARAIVVIDAALLIEAQIYTMVDEVWVVSIPPELQLVRLMSRDNFSREEALKRINAQMPLQDKLMFAQRVIDNSGSPEQTHRTVRHVWRELLHTIAQREKPEANNDSQNH